MTKYDEVESPSSCNYRLPGYMGNDELFGCGYYRSHAGARVTPCLSATSFPADCPLSDAEGTHPEEKIIINNVTGKKIPVRDRSSKYDPAKGVIGLWSNNPDTGQMNVFQKKPVIITAERIIERISIETLEGVMLGEPGAWLIQGVMGEKYPCSDEIFRKTYVPVGILKCNLCIHRNTNCGGESYILVPACRFEWDNSHEK